MKKCPRYEIFEKAIIELIQGYEKRNPINRRDEMTKLFLYLLNNEPDGKILNKKEINNFKKIFYSLDKNIITTGLSELLGWDDMFNNENNNEIANIEKILTDDDMLKNDYSFKEEDELDEAINGDINLNDIE